MYGPRMMLGPEGTSTTRGVLFVHSAPSALCPHIEWAVGGVLGTAVNPSWIPQPAQSGTYRTELAWSGDSGSAAAIASALRGWNHLRFEVTEDPTATTEGQRFSYTPDLGVFHAMTGVHGDIMIPEDRLKAAVVKAALGDTTLLGRDRQAARQAVGRRARDLPPRRRGRPGPLAAQGRLTGSVPGGAQPEDVGREPALGHVPGAVVGRHLGLDLELPVPRRRPAQRVTPGAGLGVVAVEERTSSEVLESRSADEDL